MIRAKNTSQFKGVSWSKGNKKWRAQIKINGVQKHICYSSDEKEASRRYNEIKQKLK